MTPGSFQIHETGSERLNQFLWEKMAQEMGLSGFGLCSFCCALQVKSGNIKTLVFWVFF